MAGLGRVDDLYVVLLHRYLEVLNAWGTVLHRKRHPKDWIVEIRVVKGLDLLVDDGELLGGIHAEAEHVRSAARARVDDQCWPKLGVAYPNGFDLDVGDANVEVFRKIGVPDNADIGEEEGAEVALVRAEVPYPRDLIEDLLLGELDELLLGNHRPPQLELPVELRGVVGPEDRLYRSEKAGAVADQVGEDELEAAAIELRQHVERLGVAP
mmetsp:Transcript_16406/g.41538  ORF Transcript_16406/g.41538 Transcript_16406/m.41538 type:complete len:211 (-) Transcript_16406:204-836(-)